ncbi:MAG: hypothetical protein ACRDOM_01350, partial [Nocardioides sp.]
MSTSRFLGPRGPRALVGALAALLLSSCAGTSPGVAVQVGDETITTNELDARVSEYCEALEKQLEANTTTVLNRIFRAGMAGSMAERSMAEQIAQQYAVEAGKVYDDKVATLEQSVSVLPEEVQDVVVDVETKATYVEAIQAAVGEQLMEEEGAPVGSYSDQVARGSAVFDEWAAENEITFDPGLGVDLVDGKFTPVDTSISYAVGENARAGAAEQPDP